MRNKNYDAMITSIMQGANPNVQSYNGNTLLHFMTITALHSGNKKLVDMIREILQRGARLNIQNNLGKTVLHVFGEHSHRVPAEGGDVKLINLFADRKYKLDPNIKDQDGSTALHILASKRIQGFTPEVFERLLKISGININAQDNKGDTPLHKTPWSYNKEAFDLLLEYGADITIKNNKGQTVLDVLQFIVQHVRETDLNEMIKELQKRMKQKDQ